MQIKEAVVLRIKELCENKNLKYNSLSNLAGVTPSSVYSLMGSSHSDVGIVLIKKICDAFEMTIGEFFTSEIFDKLDQEII